MGDKYGYPYNTSGGGYGREPPYGRAEDRDPPGGSRYNMQSNHPYGASSGGISRHPYENTGDSGYPNPYGSRGPSYGIGGGSAYPPREDPSYHSRRDYPQNPSRDDYSRGDSDRRMHYEASQYIGTSSRRPESEVQEFRHPVPPRDLPEQILDSRGEHDKFNTWRLSGERINRYVIQKDLCAYLGSSATMRYKDTPEGKFYYITAFRPFSEEQLRDLIQSSERYGQNPTSFIGGREKVSSEPERQQEISLKRQQEDDEMSKLSSEVSVESDTPNYRHVSSTAGHLPGYGYNEGRSTTLHTPATSGSGTSSGRMARSQYDQYYADPNYYPQHEASRTDTDHLGASRRRDRDRERETPGYSAYDRGIPSAESAPYGSSHDTAYTTRFGTGRPRYGASEGPTHTMAEEPDPRYVTSKGDLTRADGMNVTRSFRKEKEPDL